MKMVRIAANHSFYMYFGIPDARMLPPPSVEHIKYDATIIIIITGFNGKFNFNKDSNSPFTKIFPFFGFGLVNELFGRCGKIISS